MEMLGVAISFKCVSFVITGAGVTGLFTRPMVDAAYYIEVEVQLDFFLFMPSLSMVSSVQLTRGAGFDLSCSTRTR
jgi:hypothetical protein